MLMNAEERERIGDEEIRQAASHDAEIHAGRAEEGGPPIAEWVFMPHPGPESLKSARGLGTKKLGGPRAMMPRYMPAAPRKADHQSLNGCSCRIRAQKA